MSGRVAETLSHDGISSTCLVKECMELEESCSVTITVLEHVLLAHGVEIRACWEGRGHSQVSERGTAKIRS